jgi:NAD-dependent DNA ligase/DNA polymerase/3'-5' exonuclease PolX
MSSRLNETFIDLMEKLSTIMMKHGEPFRARAYQKAQETILLFPGNILTPKDLSGKPGIGTTIMDKLEEYVKTGTLAILEKEKNDPVNVLSDIYGVGPKKAKELVENGVTSISQLREKQHLLNDVQKIGLHYYEDIMKRIPRKEIKDYETMLGLIFKKIATPECKFEIVGSYRRGADTSGDIDIIVTSSSVATFTNLIDVLIKQKVILEVLSRGSIKCLVIAKLPNSDTARRVDFLFTGFEEFPFAILYFTGSKIFNTVMRQHALSLGYTMNEHGLYVLEDKKKGNKVDHTFSNEKDIFDYLNLEYKSPTERLDGRAVIVKQTKPYDTVKEFRKKGISFLEKLTETELTFILKESTRLFFNGSSIISDNEYDIIKEFTENKFPRNSIKTEIGAPVERNKVTLPYSMGSMDKIKPNTNALSTWTAKYTGPYIISCKLDGVSGLYTTEGNVPKLYTRGDGKIGQDVSHLIPYLRLPKNKDIVIRGEFIIPKTVFEQKYKKSFSNPRNMVSGIVNQKFVNDSIKDVCFVAYELIHPVKTPWNQIQILSTLDVMTVLYNAETKLTNELLTNTLIEWRNKYMFEIDGIIVANNDIYERKHGNPDHAFAFKMVLSEQVSEAKVLDVIWTPSKDGYLKPRVRIEPLQLCGVCIEYATGFNGAFIHDNKIGVGALIEIIRSGDVIPHIQKVVVPACDPKMPSVPYIWNETHVDIMLENKDMDETVKEKNITGFFKGVGVEGLSSGNISRIMQTGFDSVEKILKMSLSDFLKVDGFKEKTAAKLYNGIREKLLAASLITIMTASNIFGRGISEKKMEIILESYPDVLLSNESKTNKIKKIIEMKGMALKTAESFVERIPYFIKFMNDIGLQDKLLQIHDTQNKTVINPTNPIFGKTVVMSGFRDQVIQDKIQLYGGKLGSSVSKNTFLLIVKKKEDDSGKISDARKLNVPLMTPQEFLEFVKKF